METPTLAELAKKTYLAPDFANEIRGRISQAEETLRNESFLTRMPGVSINVDEVRKFMERDKQTLAMGTPEDYPGAVKNELHRQLKAIRGRLQHDMPTQEDMERPTPVNVDKEMAWTETHKHDILAMRSILRILDPNNDSPNFTSIELLRGNTPPKGDPRRFWRGFDLIKWDEKQEDEFSGQINDLEYYKFLELRLLQWSKPTIMKKLGWGDKEYEAALERFRRSEFTRDADVTAMELEDAEDDSGDETDEVAYTAANEMPLITEPKADKKRSRKSTQKRAKNSGGLVESTIWPWPQMKERGMSPKHMKDMSGVAPVRISSVCGYGRSEWRDEERTKIQAALDEWDKIRQFAVAKE